VVRDPRVALLFLIPGSGTTFRVNGRAVISADPELLDSFMIDGKAPRTAIVVTVQEAYFQCAPRHRPLRAVEGRGAGGPEVPAHPRRDAGGDDGRPGRGRGL
jgi:predicted pyridoxine 5'-phosphate oxidase superfamily flavin-nucleotide-binding protein